MSFRNPIRSLSADQITPGTMTGSVVQTGSTDPRVVLDPSPSSDTGTQDPALLLYGNWAGTPNARPGIVAGSVVGLVGGQARGELTIKGPTASGTPSTARRPPTLRLDSEIVDSAGTLVGDGQILDLTIGGGTTHDGQVWVSGYSGSIDTAASAYLELNVADAAAAAGGTTTALRLGSGMATITKPLRYRGTSGVAQWTAVTYRSGWADFDTTGWQGVQVRRLPDGTVQLRGLFKPTAGAANGVAFDLPAGFAPTGRNQIFPLACQSNVGATLFVNTDGSCNVNQASAATSWLSIGMANWDVT